MKLKLKKLTLMQLSNDMEVVPQALTRDIAGGQKAMSHHTGCGMCEETSRYCVSKERTCLLTRLDCEPTFQCPPSIEPLGNNAVPNRPHTCYC
ncbi:hypothetical protein [Bowmanella denitrificans]|uniref:hypothetical protein n=1 Tax=Bowmanella denitrificans TaxID=366582 RepID=UPI000C9B8292|nr:hypothetical protein [Bowmanella denitrificans]